MEVTVTRAGSGAFVGRERQLNDLSTALQSAIAGLGALFLIAGEPGIGKSRLGDELAVRARDAGGLVLWGRCWEAGGAPTYWPWVEAVRTYLRETDAAAVREQIGAGAAEIAQMIPEVGALFPELSVPNLTDPEGARFRLFDRMATFLRTASVARPIVLILDDLQSADAPSLLLLQFVARVVRDSRMLVLCLYRDDAEVVLEAPLPRTLAELRREPSTRSITLTGLEEPDVTRFIDRTMDRAPPASLVSAVYEQTEGNPLFVGEVVRLLGHEGRLSRLEPGARLSIPASVREVIGRRLDLLSDDCAELLSLASVMGQEFDIEVLAALADRAVRALIDALDEATRARVLTGVPAAPRRRRFAHALFREVLYEEISEGRRIDLHHRAAQVLEASYGVEREAHLAELAHHFFLAIPEAAPALVVEYARRAGDVAAARLAFEEAARLYGVALQALGLMSTGDEAGRCVLLLDLGDAQARSGDMPTAKATFLEAASLAKRLGRAEDLARAAVGYGGRFVWQRAGSDRHLVPLLESALAAIGEAGSSTRVRLLSRLACALRDHHDRTRSDELSALALEIARRIGDPRTLAYALDGRYGAIWWPENPMDRLALADELVGLGELGDVEGQFQGHHCRVITLLELGEIDRAEEGLDVMRRLAEEARQPWQPWVVDTISSNLALIRGRFAEAEEQITRAHSYGASALLTDAESHYASHLYTIERERGHPADAVPTLRAVARRFTWYPFFQAVLAEALLEIGDETQARSTYARIRIDDFAAMPRDNEWLFALSVTSTVCVAMGDKTGAEVLYELQLPYADRHAYGHAEGQAGSVSRALGILAAFLGSTDAAERHFEEALRMNKRMGARPWVAHAQHAYAQMLVDRDVPGDRERTIALLEDASRTCKELGMTTLGRRVAELLGSLDPSGERIGPRASRASIAAFRREGEYWTVVFDGKGFRLRDSKGVRYLAGLLAAPGREILALDLVGVVEGRNVVNRAGMDDLGVDARRVGPALDERAKGEYRRRLAELDEELAEAEEWNDPERSSRLREERDFLVRELAAAVGLGGRDRPQASDAERARVNVTRAIRGVLERITEHSPELGRHLTTTVRTGTFCSYQPDPLSPVSWST